MKYLAALAAIVLPATAQAVSQDTTQSEFVYECQITESCKANGCTPLETAKQIKLTWGEYQSKGVLLIDGQDQEVLVLPGLGTQEFLQILTQGTVGYTVNSDTGELAVRASGAQQWNERGICAVSS